jgi:hypothetical protein
MLLPMQRIKPAVVLETIDLCWELHEVGHKVRKPVFMHPDTPGFPSDIQGIISATARRTEESFEAVIHLAGGGYTSQAAMLIRSMFEDVVVAHWLLLHVDAGDYYSGRFARHREAMILGLQRVAEKYGGPTVDVSGVTNDPQALIDEFGLHVERSWWDRDPAGQKVSLPAIVAEVGTAQRFWGRTYGATPIFRETYDLAIKWSNQYLHHTALGVMLAADPEQRLSIVGPRPVAVLSRAYYCYAMVICAVIDAAGGTPQLDPFWATFMSGLQQLLLLTSREAQEDSRS